MKLLLCKKIFYLVGFGVLCFSTVCAQEPSSSVTYEYDALGRIISKTSFIDSDGDSVNDRKDAFPDDPRYTLDSDADGMADSWEQLYGLDHLTQNAQDDPDSDGLVNIDEFAKDLNPINSDTDNDGLQDGTELGLTLADIGPTTDPTFFEPDTDPTTTTDPLVADTDNDGLLDGQEDLNNNGFVDAGEYNPNVKDVFVAKQNHLLGASGTSSDANYKVHHSAGETAINVVPSIGVQSGFWNVADY